MIIPHTKWKSNKELQYIKQCPDAFKTKLGANDYMKTLYQDYNSKQ